MSQAQARARDDQAAGHAIPRTADPGHEAATRHRPAEWSALIVRSAGEPLDRPGPLERWFWAEVGVVLDRNIREGDVRITDSRSAVVLFPNTPASAAERGSQRLVSTLKEQVRPWLRFRPGWDGVTAEVFPLSEAPRQLAWAQSSTGLGAAWSGEPPARAQDGVSRSSGTERIKRGIDVMGSILLLLLTFPLWVAIAVGIKLSSRGPVLFSQKRVGLRGQPFTMHKFRTMRGDAGEDLHRRYMEEFIRGTQAAGSEKNAPFKLASDDRIFPFGQMLRRWSLDELPQLLNVLAGDMSLVGPRPSVFYELDEYRPWHRRRLAVKPGLTGLWQVYGRGRTTFDDMVRLDLQYVRRRSTLLDLKLVALTLPTVLARRGAG